MSQSDNSNDNKPTRPSSLPGRSSGSSSNTNPFRSGSSRYGSNRPGSSGSSNTPPKPPPPRFGGLGSRFGATVDFEIRPVESTFVRFDLTGLGDPFHRILGTDLDLGVVDPLAVAKALAENSDLSQSLAEELEAAWERYKLTGALLMFPWKDDIKQVIGTKPNAPARKESDDDEYYDDDDDSDEKQDPPKETRKSPVCLRAIDPGLVMNVLGRTRSGILLAQASLSLDEGFLTRSLISDDPRLVALARATGCLEETIMV